MNDHNASSSSTILFSILFFFRRMEQALSIHSIQNGIPNFVRIRNRNEDSDWIVASVTKPYQGKFFILSRSLEE
ncbi:hypothetical protein DLM78_08575 [Leptospira stimsonii]|uniref:Uncharacterized protein n=1 Tax=Leptospira stimsonii TaxID=2202203 RepID=A0A8B3CQ87_9LEPT|nr:hypothetical protein DLM78_08575 [Leptospira stimsonii]